MYVAVSGNIGAGKSTLTRILADRYQLLPVYETVDENPYLEDFYRDRRSFAFHSQVFFLSKRLEQHLQLVNGTDRVIQDRTIYEDAAVFATALHQEGSLDERDYGSYLALYSAITKALRPPDLLIYLRARLPTLQKRIRLRGRSYEHSIHDAYLHRLNDLYDRWIEEFDLAKVITIPTDHLDLVANQQDLDTALSMLEAHGLTPPILR
ncbi:MAG: deoxynucleoside kinase [Trueperaceae bacterium]|nr:MAG: deoxynucleoside kinase [Trueperaceae bacterium]